ncbi:MAG: tetratricopeptide repeat protein [Bryobacteraceae bacterium]|nr:tetratricopeptide repeat protein [Bryobacteraceae bacterium]MDW8379011.1 tetratricopeptide repeat protein [Bryobacterales bacterium]
MNGRGAIRFSFPVLLVFMLPHTEAPLAGVERLSTTYRMAPAVLRSDTTSVDDWIGEAGRYYRQGHFEAAESASRKAIELQRLNRTARYLLGLSLTAQGKFTEEALENLRQASADHPDAHLEISRIYLETGRLAEAMTELEKYLKRGQLRAK